jgi:hypothetical protein
VDDGSIVHPLECLGASLGDDRREVAIAKLELNNRVQIALLAHDAGEV